MERWDMGAEDILDVEQFRYREARVVGQAALP
jgi:hypothetical protein